MEQGARQIPIEGLSQGRGDKWAEEIRDYLLGRLAKKPRTEPLGSPQRTQLDSPPVRRWWIFEGKRYAMLNGPLAQNREWIVSQAKRLLRTFNPRLRFSDRPDGVVDWGQTLARGFHQVRQEYVMRSSGVGLDEQEHAALCGWMTWIAAEWVEYVQHVGIESSGEWPTFACETQGQVSVDRLRRWAHAARRSRWPLLHGIVAESFRPVLEPEELDRIPLPFDEPVLFELLCLVRVARCVAPPPRALRWLTAENENEIKLDGTCIYYQQSLQEDRVLATYEAELASALKFFDVSTPKRVDLRFEFESTRAGFDGIIIEAKSGVQHYDDSVPQLRAYRAARRPGSRYLIWGVVENPVGSSKTLEDLQVRFAVANKTADVWVFSSADAIPVVLSAALGTEPRQELAASGVG